MEIVLGTLDALAKFCAIGLNAQAVYFFTSIRSESITIV